LTLVTSQNHSSVTVTLSPVCLELSSLFAPSWPLAQTCFSWELALSVVGRNLCVAFSTSYLTSFPHQSSPKPVNFVLEMYLILVSCLAKTQGLIISVSRYCLVLFTNLFAPCSVLPRYWHKDQLITKKLGNMQRKS
jgi:hypothetical protein